MQKNNLQKELEKVTSDIRLDVASDLLDSLDYVIVMQHPTKGFIHTSSSKKAASVLLKNVEPFYRT